MFFLSFYTNIYKNIFTFFLVNNVITALPIVFRDKATYRDNNYYFFQVEPSNTHEKFIEIGLTIFEISIDKHRGHRIFIYINVLNLKTSKWRLTMFYILTWLVISNTYTVMDNLATKSSCQNTPTRSLATIFSLKSCTYIDWKRIYVIIVYFFIVKV